MNTIFSKIIRREIPARIIYEDDLCLAFHDVSPQAPTHVLIIPKREIPSLNEAQAGDKELLGHMLLKTAEIARSLKVSDDGYRVVLNTNSHGGQSVYHLHLHLIAGRPMNWPPG